MHTYCCTFQVFAENIPGYKKNISFYIKMLYKMEDFLENILSQILVRNYLKLLKLISAQEKFGWNKTQK